MNIVDSALLMVAVMNFTLCGLIIWNNWRSSSAIWFALFSISLGFWALTIIGFRLTDDLDLALTFLKVSYSVATCIAASFFLFVYQFPKPYPLNKIWKYILTISTLIIVILPLFPNSTILEVRKVSQVHVGIQEPVVYFLFSAYFILYFFGALYILLKRRKTTPGVMKKHINFIIWSVLIAGVLGTFFNLVLPSPFLHEWRFTWLGPIFTVIIVVMVAYAIAKHQLLNVK